MADEIKQPTCKRCEELCEELSVQVSDHIDPSVNVPWMRGSPGLPKYVQELEARAERAEKACAEMREMISHLLRYPNEGFKAVALLGRTDCGKDYVPMASLEAARKENAKLYERIERAEAACAEMRKVLEDSKKEHLGHRVSNQWFIERDRSLSTTCGSDYVRQEELDAAKAEVERLRGVLKRIANVGCSGVNYPKTCIEANIGAYNYCFTCFAKHALLKP